MGHNRMLKVRRWWRGALFVGHADVRKNFKLINANVIAPSVVVDHENQRPFFKAQSSQPKRFGRDKKN